MEEGGAKIFGVFRVENHDFTPKNHIFPNFRAPPPGSALEKRCVWKIESTQTQIMTPSLNKYTSLQYLLRGSNDFL